MRQVVVVSGYPGAGKTTLAVPLAEALGFPLLAKDFIKEQLYDSLGPGPQDPLAWSRRLGSASMEVLWGLARWCPQVVLEANFRPRSPYERAKLAGLTAQLVEVYCRCPPEVASRRFAERARLSRHHPAHVLTALSPELLSEYGAPLALGPVLEVDTTRPIEVRPLADAVRTMLEAAQSS